MKKQESGSGAGGKVLGAVNRFTAWIYSLFATSFLGRFFTSYDRLNTAAFDGFGGRFRRGMAGVGRAGRLLRRRIAGVFESSRVLRLIRRLRNLLLECSLSVYGVLFAVYGVYTLVLRLVLRGNTSGPDVGLILTGAVFLLTALPMFFSGRSLAEALGRSRIFHWLLVDIFGVDEDDLKSAPHVSGTRYVVAVSVAVIAGCLTYFVHPLVIPGIALLAVLAAMVLYQPEMGAVVTLLVCPFLSFTLHPTLYLSCILGVTAIGYLSKLICGRRTFRFGLLEGMVGFFVLLVLFGGFFTLGGKASLRSALMYAFLIAGGFFLILNLARTRVWLRRCAIALGTSCTLVSVVGVVQYALGYAENSWLDQSLFSGISGRVTSVFKNPNMLAVFLVLILPLLFGFIITQRRFSTGFFLTIAAGVSAACLILTWSRGAWLGTVVAFVFMLLLISHKTLSTILLAAFPVYAGATYLSPYLTGYSLLDSITGRFASIGNLGDSSTLYRVYTWRGVGNMIRDHLLGGVGVGEIAFGEVYPLYALSGIETVMHSHSLYLEILAELGVVGLIVFLVCMFLFVQMCLGSLKKMPDQRMRVMVIAGLCGVLGTMIMGLADYIWYNYSVCFLFWAVIGLTAAYVRVGKEETERTYLPTENSPGEAEVTVRF